MSSPAMPYVGSRISLVSKSEIRYEGILYVINTEESTIALQNVRSFGTEGRTQPDVPPTDEVYDFIIFRGEDIKDLTVLEGSSAKPSQRAVLEDPAVVRVGPERKVTQNKTHDSRESSSREHRGQQRDYQPDRYGGRGANNMRGYEKKWEDRRENRSNGTGYQRSAQRDYKEDRGHHKGQGKGSFGGKGSHRYHNTHKGEPIGELQANENAKTKAEVGSEEFDFSIANEKFEKPVEISKEVDNARTGYSKTKGFFDDISCDALDRAAGKDNRFDRSARDKHRELDKETFGASANVRPFGGYRRFHHGKGHGKGKAY